MYRYIYICLFMYNVDTEPAIWAASKPVLLDGIVGAMVMTLIILQ